MNAKNLTITLLSALVLTACNLGIEQDAPPPPVPEALPPAIEVEELAPSEGSLLLEGEAKEIAERDCIKGGESVDGGYYNPNSKTWWFEANLNVTKEGCNPACVVYEDGTVEINWRCTGAIMENTDIVPELTALFIAKNPEYKDTLTVRVDQQTATHARGGVIFDEGMPGGYFLAAKVDGEWNIVLEGNGQIPCTLSEQGFPPEMISDCAS